LDLVVTKVVEITHQKLHFYDCNYSKFLIEREERRVMQQAAFDNQQQYIREQERFIERFKAKASKATQAQSRVKMLDKLDRVDAPESDEAGMVLKFHVARKSGVDVVKLKHINKSFGEKVILQDAEGLIQRGDKIGLIGANGMGKSTLLRIIVGTEPHEGEVIHGHNVEATFFAQHQLEALDIKQTIWEEVYKSAPNKTDAQVRAILGCFLFSGDDVHKKIQVLSGGEKSRVALAKTLLQEANFLMLDEPTNHLDMQSIQILMEALKNYEGTFIVVSHDRYFLSEICNKIWYIENTKIKEYPGTYEEYDYWRKQNPQQVNGIPKATAKPEPKPVAKADPSVDNSKKINQLKNQLKKAEEQLEKLEKQKKKLEEEMAKPSLYNDVKAYAKIQAEYNALTDEIKTVTQTWEETYIELER
jgi:ATP-binding cassette subfamily F protein 3